MTKTLKIPLVVSAIVLSGCSVQDSDSDHRNGFVESCIQRTGHIQECTDAGFKLFPPFKDSQNSNVKSPNAIVGGND